MSKILTMKDELVLPEGSKDEEEVDLRTFNPSGIKPVEYKCLVKPYNIVETDAAYKSARDAGIIVDPVSTEREQYAQCVALLVAVGGNAFEDWKDPIPQAGDRINIAKYAGVETLGVDGRSYRLVNDKDIVGILFQPEGDDPFDEEDD
jgi:co-chaperonin GroES (HSP10)